MEREIECTKTMLKKNNNWKIPFGDEKAGKRIIEMLIGEHK
jgi:hypothetical protein